MAKPKPLTVKRFALLIANLSLGRRHLLTECASCSHPHGDKGIIRALRKYLTAKQVAEVGELCWFRIEGEKICELDRERFPEPRPRCVDLHHLIDAIVEVVGSQIRGK